MREFLFGHETGLELFGWHVTVILALLIGYHIGRRIIFFVRNGKRK